MAGGGISAALGRAGSVKVEKEFTGMVFCPQRQSHIAMLRCAEYQREYGCGVACKNAATPEQINMVVTDARQDIDEGEEEPRCLICGKAKKTRVGKRCRDCSSRVNSKLRLIVRARRKLKT